MFSGFSPGGAGLLFSFLSAVDSSSCVVSLPPPLGPLGLGFEERSSGCSMGQSFCCTRGNSEQAVLTTHFMYSPGREPSCGCLLSISGVGVEKWNVGFF